MSDIHGDLLAFKRMLKKISFNEKEDSLIINGDILDRGEHGIELIFMVKDMVDAGYAVAIKGNHELYAQRFMEGKLSAKEWTSYSGGATLRELLELDDKKKEELLDFIKKMPLYIEYEGFKARGTVINHTGLMEGLLVTGPDEKIDVVESVKKAAETDEDDLLISADIHYWGREQLGRLDKFIICGHIATYQLGPEYTGKILENRNYMDVDAGAGFREQGGKLACYCLDNGNVWYV